QQALLPGHEEQRASVARRLGVVDPALEPALELDVRAADEVDLQTGRRRVDALAHEVDPGTRGIDQRRGAPDATRSVLRDLEFVALFHAPAAHEPRRTGDAPAELLARVRDR